ncbi:uncharacterized protein BJ212DRAFT_1589239 [Suillus subaureus]|uniref:Uncharacterized protein n=1 Tax=Suillus subaureus TaxID=48587 RepID=A0A9P7E5E4_9AGAM|nr:uncharacterized protein BJ212DRAFT_1589239 [Suillus subaureus]KAG1811776.1 hypothetical protein BJ212DRAFT_1589239 [Suillus subaureus]
MKTDVPKVGWCMLEDALHESLTINKSAISISTSVKTAQDPETPFMQAPPLLTEPRDADDLLAGPKSISPDDGSPDFAVLKELKRTEEDESFDEVEVLEEMLLILMS